MPFVANDSHMPAVAVVPFDLPVDFSDKRTDRIEGHQPSLLGIFQDRGRNAVRGQHDDAAGWDLVEFLDEDRAFGLKAANYIEVMDDRPPDVDRCAMDSERIPHSVDRAPNAGAEAARRSQQDLKVRTGQFRRSLLAGN